MLILWDNVVNLSDQHQQLIFKTIDRNNIYGYTEGEDGEDYKLNLSTGMLSLLPRGSSDPKHVLIDNYGIDVVLRLKLFDVALNQELERFRHLHPDDNEIIPTGNSIVTGVTAAHKLKHEKLLPALNDYFMSPESTGWWIPEDSVANSFIQTLARHQVEGDEIIKGLKAQGVDLEVKLVKNYLGGYTKDTSKTFEDLALEIVQQGK